MSAIDGRRRRRTWWMFVVSVLILGSVPALGWVGARAILDSRGGKAAAVSQLPVVPFPSTPTGVLLTHAGKRLTSVTVFVVAPGGVGGSIISVPVNADFGLADAARQSLQHAYEQDGTQAALDALSALLPVALDWTADYDEAATSTWLDPIGKVAVTLPEAVPATKGRNDAIAAGTATLEPAQLAQVLTSAPAEFKKEDSRRGDLEAVWAGIGRAIGSGKQIPGLDPTATPASFEDIASHVFAGKVQTRGLTAVALTATQNPSQLDVEQLDRSEAVFVFAAVAPGEMSPTAQGSTFRLVAPPGYDAAVKRTIDLLLYVSANVVSVDTTAAPQADTVMYVPDESAKADAEYLRKFIGEFSYGTPTQRINGVDITVVLGTTYLAKAAGS